jgi:hypothetical protein
MAKLASNNNQASEMAAISRAELDSLKAEVKRLRHEVGRSTARARMEADPSIPMIWCVAWYAVVREVMIGA